MKPSRLTACLLSVFALQAELRPLWRSRRRHPHDNPRRLNWARWGFIDARRAWFAMVRERHQIDSGEGVSIWQAIEAGLAGEDWA